MVSPPKKNDLATTAEAQPLGSRVGASCNGIVEGHERTLIARFLVDEGSIRRYPSLKPEYFTSPAHREIFSAIQTLNDDGRSTCFPLVQDFLHARGRLQSNGEKNLVSSIAADNQITAMNDACFDYALDCVMDAYREREGARIAKELLNGKITVAVARDKLEGIQKPLAKEQDWLATIDTATVSSGELASLKLDQRRKLLGEWLCEGDYGIVFAPRGVGKTWFGLMIAKAVSTGGKLGEWEARGAAKVLYLDGEMPADMMRDRDRGLGRGQVEFLNHEILFDRTEKVLNITDPAVQQAILSRCLRDNIKLLVLDNLSTLASGVKENDSFEWECLQGWLLQFRRHRIAVILIHHAGRNGEPRGTSKREDAAFWVIALDDAKQHSDDKRGARFVSRFSKPSRNTQSEIPPYEWHVVTDKTTGQVTVGCKAARSIDVFRQLIEEGVTECNHLAGEMQTSPATISRMAKKGFDAGWLKKKGREYMIVKDGKEVKFEVVEDENE